MTLCLTIGCSRPRSQLGFMSSPTSLRLRWLGIPPSCENARCCESSPRQRWLSPVSLGAYAKYMPRYKRHGLLTAYLIFKLIAYSATLFAYVFAADRILATAPSLPRWTLSVFIVWCVVGLIATVAIFQWKMWGFYAICALGIAGFVLNLYAHVSPVMASLGLLGPVILYGLLRLGGERNAWSQLQ